MNKHEWKWIPQDLATWSYWFNQQIPSSSCEIKLIKHLLKPRQCKIQNRKPIAFWISIFKYSMANYNQPIGFDKWTHKNCIPTIAFQKQSRTMAGITFNHEGLWLIHQIKREYLAMALENNHSNSIIYTCANKYASEIIRMYIAESMSSSPDPLWIR